jgi:hypothetical protein
VLQAYDDALHRLSRCYSITDYKRALADVPEQGPAGEQAREAQIDAR